MLPPCPMTPTRVYASMGNYIFATDVLLRELYADSQNENSSHDFGKDILPSLIGRSDMCAYDFNTNVIPGDPIGAPHYWRDVGTFDAYYEASMDLKAVSPELNLYNRQWPLRTAGYFDAPAKFVFDEEGRRGMAMDSIIAGSSIVSGGFVKGQCSAGSANPHRRSNRRFSHLRQLRHRAPLKVRRAILDKNVKIPEIRVLATISTKIESGIL